MNTYLVGGAVRDDLLGIPATDRDWVVVGASPGEMAEKGFRPVGKDFPVFLHPSTQEEYALARTERKTAAGYHGFSFNTSREVTLEEDLQRRDLTINAIARDENGELIDPWGGKEDLQNRVLRHVSPAFAEDPLRVLRVARFAAKLARFDFTIAPDTMQLMRKLTASGELQTLAAERVWQELHTSLGYKQPEPFFAALRECDALRVVLPELDRLYGVPLGQNRLNIDCAEHTMMALTQACLLTPERSSRFATLCHALGKGSTPTDGLPVHQGPDTRGAELCKALCDRLKSPADYRELAILAARFHCRCHRALELKPDELIDFLTDTDAQRRPERFEKFLLCCTASAQPGEESTPYPQAEFMRGALGAVQQVNAGKIAQQYKAEGGAAIAKAIQTARLAALTDYCGF